MQHVVAHDDLASSPGARLAGEALLGQKAQLNERIEQAAPRSACK
jgi:hypothetical protein